MQYIAAVTGSGAVVDRVKNVILGSNPFVGVVRKLQRRFATTTRADSGSTLRFNSIFEEIQLEDGSETKKKKNDYDERFKKDREKLMTYFAAQNMNEREVRINCHKWKEVNVLDHRIEIICVK